MLRQPKLQVCCCSSAFAGCMACCKCTTQPRMQAGLEKTGSKLTIDRRRLQVRAAAFSGSSLAAHSSEVRLPSSQYSVTRQGGKVTTPMIDTQLGCLWVPRLRSENGGAHVRGQAPQA